MARRENYLSFKELLDKHGINKLYHFTDRDNLQSIIENGGLYSWADCESKGITIPKPGGGDLSRSLDRRDNLQNYVRVSFVDEHPMMFVAMDDDRITNPVILEIDPEVIFDENTKFADRNATRNGANVGGSLDDFKNIHFDSVKADDYFDLDEEEQPFYQAEVLVKNFIPLDKIINISNFGVRVPASPKQIQSRIPYTAQITRNTPTAFIFLLDHSVSMSRETTLMGERMTMAEAVARIVNRQINELVLRCIKSNEVRHYFDIAVVGYGERSYSAWEGALKDRDFVSPEELRDNPFKRIMVKEEKRTRRGTVVKEVEKVQWVQADHSGHWTHFHDAFDHAKRLLRQWMEQHHDKDCYPPTVIHITDGQYNGATKDEVQQKANELKSMFTNDGNVLLFNIHINVDNETIVTFPKSKDELNSDRFATDLFELSSLLPLRYNEEICKIKATDSSKRHSAMAVNADMTTLIKLMDIGTPTNISVPK
ncbi:DarT ssDNA thymidine ADP-ribosyltransferase family protein [uncultured Duncaniella sp.]|uniref:DarT ssDNA thymidine ADP-ribosyltransferase family protein n=1 Tax=uncultured Duncaniella sp. TaxID=2768039 RepID=UPI0025D69690|nr:DarT ssDNA thymidine ADP-ribosyltransferase family protein [uncultured Duncaniella sp.]